MKNFLGSIFVLIIISCFIGCEKNKESDNKESSAITESDVIGFYSGRGLYNAAEATLELNYGGSFEMQDPMLPEEGPAFGKWIFRGSAIDFYMNGQKAFSANISKRILTANDVNEGTDKMKVGGLILKGQVWKKLR
jgi:hypothetical protein